VAGGNFASVLSYGDVTVGAVGTTTLVCHGQALAFGHPFNLAGAVSYGADDADSLTIVRDPVYGSYKLANITAPFGTLDQDRTAGVRTRLGALPATTPVVVKVHDLDSGRSRTGTTRLTDQSWLSTLAPSAVLADFDTVFDEVGDGSATGTWTLKGTRAGGKPFTVTRTDRYASSDDIAVEPAYDVAYAVDQIVNNEFEKVHVTSLTVDSSVTTTFRQSRITGVSVSVNGGTFHASSSLRVRVGDALRVRVSLRGYQSSKTHKVTVALKVPKKSAGTVGQLEVTGGLESKDSEDEDSSACLLIGDGCGDATPASSLPGLIKGVVAAPHNDDVLVGLALESEDSDTVRTASTTRRYSSVVTGDRTVAVSVRR